MVPKYLWSLFRVLTRFDLLEELECGIAPDLKLLGNLALLSSVQLAQLDGGVLLSQLTGSLGVLGGKGLHRNRNNCQFLEHPKLP